jgi:hypothetical protein
LRASKAAIEALIHLSKAASKQGEVRVDYRAEIIKFLRKIDEIHCHAVSLVKDNLCRPFGVPERSKPCMQAADD